MERKIQLVRGFVYMDKRDIAAKGFTLENPRSKRGDPDWLEGALSFGRVRAGGYEDIALYLKGYADKGYQPAFGIVTLTDQVFESGFVLTGLRRDTTTYEYEREIITQLDQINDWDEYQIGSDLLIPKYLHCLQAQVGFPDSSGNYEFQNFEEFKRSVEGDSYWDDLRRK